MDVVLDKPMAAGKGRTLAARETVIFGKILRVRRHEKHFYTSIICPAADEFSRPSIVELRSEARFGDADEKVRVIGALGGYEGKAYRVVDKDTGETRMVTPVVHFLDFVEKVAG